MFESPVIVASMFYEGDDLVIDAEKAQIDEAKVVERLEKTENLSKTYEVPYMIDIEVPSVELAPKILSTVAENTDKQFWISSFNDEMRKEACKTAAKAGVAKRAYYSTLNYMSDEDEFRMVADLGINPIIQVFNPHNPLPDGYLEKADELLTLADKTGINKENIMLLSTVLDFGSLPLALMTVSKLKDKYSLPVCVPSVGPIYKWAGEASKNERRMIVAATMTYTLDAGADLLHIGTIKRSFIAFPVVSLIDRFEKRRKQFL